MGIIPLIIYAAELALADPPKSIESVESKPHSIDRGFRDRNFGTPDGASSEAKEERRLSYRAPSDTPSVEAC